jgi:histone deacetylase 1/2
VPPPWNANIVFGEWVFCYKLKPDGSLDRYKARWVLHGFSQEQGIDFDETFSPAIKPATVYIILSITLSLKWDTRQLDVKNTYLHDKLAEVVYCRQATGFINSTCPAHVFRLNCSLYGLKQAPHALYERFAAFITSVGYTFSHSDTSLFVLQ